MDNDGNEFIALDADFFGDGETDATTQPLSTYKENQINANTKWLVKNTVRICACPNTILDGTGEPRPMGSILNACRFQASVTIYPHDETLRLIMRGFVQNDTAVGQVVAQLAMNKVGVGLTSGEDNNNFGWGDNPLSQLRNSTTWIEDQDGDYIVELDIRSVTNNMDRPEVLNVYFNTSSLEDGVVRTDMPIMDWIGSDFAFDPQTFQMDATTDFPNELFLTGKNAITTDHPSDYKRADFLGFFDDPNNALVAGHAPVLDATVGDTTWDDTDYEFTGSDYQVYDISYILPRSWILEVDSSAEKPFNAGDGITYNKKSPASMEAQVPIEGPDVSTTGRNLDGTFTREKVVASGPANPLLNETEDTSGDLPSGIRPKWILKKGSANKVLDHVGFHLDHPEVELKINGSIFGIDFNASELDEPNVVPRRRRDWNDLNIHNARIKYKVSVVQLQAGDENWADATTLYRKDHLFSNQLFCYQAIDDHTKALLRQMFFSFYDNVLDPSVGKIGASFGDYRPSIQEGSLFVDRGDLGRMQNFSITVPLENVDITKPVRLVIEQSADISGDAMELIPFDTEFGPQIEAISDDRSKIYVLIPSYTVEQRRLF